MKIGFFDSGLGGLTILESVVKALPDYDYAYYGDTANLPYGDKTEEEIFNLTRKGIEELFKLNCLLVIIACNTASAETLRKLQDNFLPESYPNRRILGVVIPTIEALKDSSARRVLLLATKRTIESGKYAMEFQKHSLANTTLYSVATPGLVPLIEEGKMSEAVQLAKEYIDKESTRVGEVDTVVLGCTHYTRLKSDLRAGYKDRLNILSQDEIIPSKLELYLSNHTEIESRLSKEGTRKIKLTKEREDYQNFLQSN